MKTVCQLLDSSARRYRCGARPRLKEKEPSRTFVGQKEESTESAMRNQNVTSAVLTLTKGGGPFVCLCFGYSSGQAGLFLVSDRTFCHVRKARGQFKGLKGRG